MNVADNMLRSEINALELFGDMVWSQEGHGSEDNTEI